jgi:hypothetical protein
MSKPDDPGSTIEIPLEAAIDCFLELALRDKWIRSLSDDEMNLIQWYIVERRPCPEGLMKRGEEAFHRREEMLQQRRDGERWVRTHVRRINPTTETRTPIEWDDVHSTHRIKSALGEMYSRADLKRALLERFGRLPEPTVDIQASAPARGTPQSEESPPPTAPPAESTVAGPASTPSKPVAPKRTKRRGPDRYGKDDRALFGQMTVLGRTEQLSPQEAAYSLRDKIKGRGSLDSRVRRLARRYRKEVLKQ